MRARASSGEAVRRVNKGGSHARVHLRVSRFLLDGPRKRETARSLANSWLDFDSTTWFQTSNLV